ncbi:hypothetical protein K1W54_04730 [Micromonospora sp. CPCC 205371]|nr:hypothetical protein [Micromonospora sp. CPCC 205371]
MKHLLSLAGHSTETDSWLSGVEGLRFVIAPGVGGVGMGLVIQNPDGSIVVARIGDTLVYDNGRVDVER